MSYTDQVKISTGFKDLDEKIQGGLNPGNLLCVGARPSMGKTSFLLSIANNLEQNEIPFKFISMEENPEKLSDRTQSFVPRERFCSTLTRIEEIGSFIEAYSDEFKIFFLDGFNLIKSRGFSSILQEISINLHALKSLCMSLGVCIVFTCQLSRKVEERASHRPMMTDLRDSGEIEEVCDILLMILRREYYDQQDKPGLAEIIIAKNRQGALGTVNLNFSKEDLFSDHEALKYVPVDEDDEPQSSFGAFMPS